MTGTLYFPKTVSVCSKLSEHHYFLVPCVTEGRRMLIGIFCNSKDEEDIYPINITNTNRD